MRTLLALLIPAFLNHCCLGQNEDSRRDFGFRPLEIHTFDNGTGRLIVTDMNQDGLDDVLFANNHVSRLEILIRKPTPETIGDLPELEECFENRGLIVDQGIKAIRTGDLNGDGRPDIAAFGTTIGLILRYQQEDGTFNIPERVFVKNPSSVSTIQLGDLNGDGMTDILVCRRDSAELLWNSVERPFQEKKNLPFSSDQCYYGDIVDINRDEIPDLAFHYSASRNPLKIRFGKGNGLFGIEQAVDLPQRQYMDIFQAEGAPSRIGMVLRNRIAFRLYEFFQEDQPLLPNAQEVSPGRIGLEGTSRKSSPAWLTADFNDDGYDDLLAAAPELSRLHLYSGGPEGLDPEPQRIDTLSEVSRLSRLSNGDILAVSKKEKVAAIHSAQQLDRFPVILPAPGNVLAGCADAAEGRCWLICRNEEKEILLVRTENTGDSASVYPFDLRNDPEDLLAFRLSDTQTGLIVFMPYDMPKMYLFEDGVLEEITSESFRALTQPLALSNIRLNAPGDGSELTVSHGPIARRFKWENDCYTVVSQFNPENPQGELIASCAYELLDGSRGVFVYDRNAGDLVRFSGAGDAEGRIHIPDADQTVFDLVQLGNPMLDSILLLDRTGINLVTGGGKHLDVMPLAEYVSASENPMLAYAKRVELGAPPRPMTALVDPANRAIELISRKDGELEKELLFEVFLASDFSGAQQARGTEPHDLESGDLNGDGIGDLVVLCQDKLLIYLGE